MDLYPHEMDQRMFFHDAPPEAFISHTTVFHLHDHHN